MWKVIIPEETGASKAYLTPNTAEPYSDWSQHPNGYKHPLNDFFGNRDNITTAQQWRNPKTWEIQIRQLESILDFEASLPSFNFLVDDDIDF